eukprot:4447382-Amphidinium_carterae.1
MHDPLVLVGRFLSESCLWHTAEVCVEPSFLVGWTSSPSRRMVESRPLAKRQLPLERSSLWHCMDHMSTKSNVHTTGFKLLSSDQFLSTITLNGSRKPLT